MKCARLAIMSCAAMSELATQGLEMKSSYLEVRWNRFTKNLKRSAKAAVVFLASAVSAYAANGKMPIDDTELVLPNGRKIASTGNSSGNKK